MKRLVQRLLPFIAAFAALAAHAQPLRIGVTPGSLADSVQVAAQEARQQGLDVKVVEFTDWTAPNTALAAGDIDLNYFQHQAFLDNAIRERGYKVESVGVGLLPLTGLYSKKYKSPAEIPNGAVVGVANDPVNQARGLALLQAVGLIQLKPGVGAKATVNDVAANPRKLKIVEIEGPQLVRALDDMALAQGYPEHFISAGQVELAGQALRYTTADDVYYAIRFVARSDRKSDPRIQQFIHRYQTSAAVDRQIKASYSGNDKLYALPWRNAPSASPGAAASADTRASK